MVQLVLLLLGVDYLRKRWRTLFVVGLLWLLMGVGVFIDALDNAIYFPMQFLAYLLLAEGIATLAVAWTGAGGQRILRYVKGVAVVLAAALILAGHHHGNFVLSMIFGTLFLADGLLQTVSAFVVRYPRWRIVLALSIVEILLAIFFFQPYPTHYVGTAPYCLGLGLAVRRLEPAVDRAARTRDAAHPAGAKAHAAPFRGRDRRPHDRGEVGREIRDRAHRR